MAARGRMQPHEPLVEISEGAQEQPLHGAPAQLSSADCVAQALAESRAGRANLVEGAHGSGSRARPWRAPGAGARLSE